MPRVYPGRGFTPGGSSIFTHSLPRVWSTCLPGAAPGRRSSSETEQASSYPCKRWVLLSNQETNKQIEGQLATPGARYCWCSYCNWLPVCFQFDVWLFLSLSIRKLFPFSLKPVTWFDFPFGGRTTWCSQIHRLYLWIPFRLISR